MYLTIGGINGNDLQLYDATKEQLYQLIENPNIVATKEQCRLIKLAAFGDKASARGSLRNNDNVIRVDGVEADYDNGIIPIDHAAKLLEVAGIEAILYNTPSHRPDSHRWRVLCPTSRPIVPNDRELLVAKLNGALGGVLAKESFTLSQMYYIDRVAGREYRTIRTTGQTIDMVQGITPIGKPEVTRPAQMVEAQRPYTPNPTEHECLEYLCDQLRRAGPGDRHSTRLRIGKLAGGYIGGGVISEETATAALLAVSDQISSTGQTTPTELSTILDSIQAGKLSPILLFKSRKVDAKTVGFGRGVQIPAELMRRNDGTDWKTRLNQHIALFNTEHASLIVGGRHKVMRKRNGCLEFFDRRTLELLYEHTIIQAGEKIMASGEIKPIFKTELLAWAQHQDCLTYLGGIEFAPGRILTPDKYNTYQGFAVAPEQNSSLVGRIYTHILQVVCAGNVELNDYVLNWIAFTFQHPEKPAGTALVLRGEKGSGKGTLGHFLRRIWGAHGLQIASTHHLTGNFNSLLADCCFLFADEAFFSGDKKSENILKALITEPTLVIERKGIDAVSQPNYLKILMATNHEYAVPASRDERRFCVCDVSASRIGNIEYFKALHTDCLSTKVQAAFLADMLARNITAFNIGIIPETTGLREQRYYSLNSLQLWLADSLLAGSFDRISWRPELSSTELFNYYLAWCESAKVGEYRRFSQRSFGIYLTKLFDRVRRNTGFWYLLGSLEIAVNKFEKFEKITLEEVNHSQGS